MANMSGKKKGLGRLRQKKQRASDDPLTAEEFNGAMETVALARDLVDQAALLYRTTYEKEGRSQQAREVMADVQRFVESRTVSETDQKYQMWLDVHEAVLSARAGDLDGASPSARLQTWLTLWACSGSAHQDFVQRVESPSPAAALARTHFEKAIGAVKRADAVEQIWRALRALGEKPGKTPASFEALVMKHRKRQA